MSALLVAVGHSVTFPCLATDPDVSEVRLETCSGSPLPSGMHYEASLERGVVLESVQQGFQGCYRCAGRLNGEEVKSGEYELDIRLGRKMDFFLFIGLL